ncbi:DedA family protein [Naumannella halotolerans]|uniref:DedA family protein n=1 Tax=Naumannella halotolerans TaxID=993414 RepID=UPI00370DA54F
MDRIVDWVVGLMELIGAPGAGLAVALENLFPPIPSEVILPLAGFTAARGGMNLAEALIWTTAGSLVGALALYALGALIGRDRIRWIIDKMPLVDVEDYDKTEAWFIKHGKGAIFFGRMIPIFRSLISIPAGVTRMSLPLFILFTTAGSAIWNTIFVMAGYLLGDNWHIVEEYASIFQKIVIAVVVAALAYWLFRRIQKIRARRARGGEEVPVDPSADTLARYGRDEPSRNESGQDESGQDESGQDESGQFEADSTGRPASRRAAAEEDPTGPGRARD